MAFGVDVKESSEKKRNGTLLVSSTKGCFESGRRQNERVCDII